MIKCANLQIRCCIRHLRFARENVIVSQFGGNYLLGAADHRSDGVHPGNGSQRTWVRKLSFIQQKVLENKHLVDLKRVQVALKQTWLSWCQSAVAGTMCHRASSQSNPTAQTIGSHLSPNLQMRPGGCSQGAKEFSACSPYCFVLCSFSVFT